MRLAALLLLSVALAAVSSTVCADTNEDVDRGDFVISVRGQAVGGETFGIENRADSVVCKARSYRTQRTSQGDEPIEKEMRATFGRADWALRYYQSNETFRGQ